MKSTTLLPLIFSAICSLCAATLQKGPYTLYELEENVYRIEDSNDSNPPGIVWGEDGKPVSFNNCSDMYLIVGTETALLMDLSNVVEWSPDAEDSLRDLVYGIVGERDLAITFTHHHGDHLGMLRAFAADHRAEFWVNEAEFTGEDMFPAERTTTIGGEGRLDLGGGMLIDYFELPGHTAHSTVFFLEGKSMMFSGDAIGSGDDVWLFNYESLYEYQKSIDQLIQYIQDPKNRIDDQRFAIYGGHYWQKGQTQTLKTHYIYDMKCLIQKIGDGSAEIRELKTFLPFLNASFKYDSAGIAWNREAAEQYQIHFQNNESNNIPNK